MNLILLIFALYSSPQDLSACDKLKAYAWSGENQKFAQMMEQNPCQQRDTLKQIFMYLVEAHRTDLLKRFMHHFDKEIVNTFDLDKILAKKNPVLLNILLEAGLLCDTHAPTPDIIPYLDLCLRYGYPPEKALTLAKTHPIFDRIIPFLKPGEVRNDALRLKNPDLIKALVPISKFDLIPELPRELIPIVRPSLRLPSDFKLADFSRKAFTTYTELALELADDKKTRHRIITQFLIDQNDFEHITPKQVEQLKEGKIPTKCDPGMTSLLLDQKFDVAEVARQLGLKLDAKTVEKWMLTQKDHLMFDIYRTPFGLISQGFRFTEEQWIDLPFWDYMSYAEALKLCGDSPEMPLAKYYAIIKERQTLQSHWEDLKYLWLSDSAPVFVDLLEHEKLRWRVAGFSQLYFLSANTFGYDPIHPSKDALQRWKRWLKENHPEMDTDPGRYLERYRPALRIAVNQSTNQIRILSAAKSVTEKGLAVGDIPLEIDGIPLKPLINSSYPVTFLDSFLAGTAFSDVELCFWSNRYREYRSITLKRDVFVEPFEFSRMKNHTLLISPSWLAEEPR